MDNTIAWIVVAGILVFYTINKFEKELENTISKVSDLEERLDILENKNRDDDDYTDEYI